MTKLLSIKVPEALSSDMNTNQLRAASTKYCLAKLCLYLLLLYRQNKEGLHENNPIITGSFLLPHIFRLPKCREPIQESYEILLG